jgi:hypothetical protein
MGAFSSAASAGEMPGFASISSPAVREEKTFESFI